MGFGETLYVVIVLVSDGVILGGFVLGSVLFAVLAAS